MVLRQRKRPGRVLAGERAAQCRGGILEHSDERSLMSNLVFLRRVLLRRSLAGIIAVAGLGSFAMAADNVLKPGAQKPASAKVLFDGKDESQWVVFGSHHPADWPIENGALTSAKHDIATRDKFKDFQLHVEFNEPVLGPQFKSQDRGNSGVYLQGRYELQVLDSYHNDTYAKGGCAAIYGVADPLKNVAKPPGQWQTYDITLHPARFENGKKTQDAHVTVYWNGQLVHDNTNIPGPTGGGAEESDEGGPIRLQFHHHAVRFRNIWIVPLNGEK